MPSPEKLKKILELIDSLNYEELLIVSLVVNEKQKLLKDKTSLDKLLIQNRTLICPKCHSTNIWRNGIEKNGHQKYICKFCKKTFRATNTSVFHSTKKNIIPYNKFIDLTLKNLSLKEIASEMNINVKTAFLWRHKIMETVEDFEEGMILSGTIWIDEYQMSSNSKGRKFEFSRPQRHHGNDPVDSINDDCVTILLAIDDNDHIFAKFTNYGKNITSQLILDNLKDRIQEGSTIITDFNTVYNELVELLKLKHIDYKSKDHSEETLLEMSTMNNLCSNLTEFFDRFHGIKDKYLNKYLGLFIFLKHLKYTEEDNRQKIYKAFIKAVNSRCKLKLRDLYKG